MTTNAVTVVERAERSAVAVQLSERSQALLSLLPDEAAVKRFQRVTLQALSKNPELLDCTPDSVVSAVMEAAAMGLEPTGAIGGAHLVTFNTKVSRHGEPDRWEKRAQLVPDFRGVVRLVTRKRADGSPSDVVSMSADVVKEGDEFSFVKGLHPVLEHKPTMAPDRSRRPTTHVYAVAQLRAGEPLFIVMDRSEIEGIRNRGKKKGISPWDTDWDEMGKKTAIKRLSKLLPVEPEVRAILAREDELADQPEPVAPAAPVGVTAPRTRQLAARLAPAPAAAPEPEPEPLPAVTDDDEDFDAIADAAFSELPPVASMSSEAFNAWLAEHKVGREYAGSIAAQMWPGIKKLDDVQRAALAAQLEKEEAA